MRRVGSESLRNREAGQCEFLEEFLLHRDLATSIRARVSRRRVQVMWLAWGWSVYVRVLISHISLRHVPEGWQAHGSLAPTEDPDLLTGIAAMATAAGVLIGGVLKGISALLEAQEDAEANRMRAQAELHYAQADMARAKRGFPPGPHVRKTAAPEKP